MKKAIIIILIVLILIGVPAFILWKRMPKVSYSNITDNSVDYTISAAGQTLSGTIKKGDSKKSLVAGKYTLVASYEGDGYEFLIGITDNTGIVTGYSINITTKTATPLKKGFSGT